LTSLWFDPGLVGLFITLTLLHLGEDINHLFVSRYKSDDFTIFYNSKPISKNPSWIAFRLNCYGCPKSRWLACIRTTSHIMSSKYFLVANAIDTFLVTLTPRNTNKDPLGPMSRSKTKALKDALNALILKVSTMSDLKGSLEYQEEALVHLIHVQERPHPALFAPWGEDNKEK